MEFQGWHNNSITFRYTRIFIVNGQARLWESQTRQASNHNEAKNIVNEWNRIAVMQFIQHPENGLWVYVEEK